MSLEPDTTTHTAPEPGDGEAAPLSTTVASLTTAEGVLTGVNRALEALDQGTYGTCTVCGQPLTDAELVADPTLTHCPAHRVAG